MPKFRLGVNLHILYLATFLSSGCWAQIDTTSFPSSAPLPERCVFMKDMLMGKCLQSVADVLPMPNGVVPAGPGQRITCPSLTCSMMPAKLEWSGMEACMLVLNNTCTSLSGDPRYVANQQNTCCPNDTLGSTVLNQFPTWQNFRDFAVDNSYTVNFWGGLTVTVPAYAYSTRGTAVAVFDMSYTPAMVPSPPRYAMISSVGVVALQRTPSKPINISYDVFPWVNTILDTRVVPTSMNRECNRQQVVAESELTLFYYEKAVDKWVSLTQGHFYNRTSRVVTAQVQPDVLARNDLLLFVTVLLGVQNSSQQQQYTMSSVGIQPQEVFRNRWEGTQSQEGEGCIFPIPMDSAELAKISEQGLTALGSPYLLKVPADQEVMNRMAVIPIPPQDTLYFEYASASFSLNNMGRRRRRRRLLTHTSADSASTSFPASGGRRLLTHTSADVEQYLVQATTPSFYNTTSQQWQALPGCQYMNASRAYVCSLTASFIRQNGFEVMYVNTVQTIILPTPPPPPPASSPPPPPSSTPEDIPIEVTFSLLVPGIAFIVFVLIVVVVIVLLCVFVCPGNHRQMHPSDTQPMVTRMLADTPLVARAAVMNKNDCQYARLSSSMRSGDEYNGCAKLSSSTGSSNDVKIPVLQADVGSFFGR